MSALDRVEALRRKEARALDIMQEAVKILEATRDVVRAARAELGDDEADERRRAFRVIDGGRVGDRPAPGQAPLLQVLT